MADKTKEQLIDQIKLLQERIAELEARDSGRKKLELMLRESEEKYRTLFNAVPVTISITSQEGKLLEVNNVIDNMLGYSPEEFAAINMNDIYVDPEGRRRMISLLQKDGKVRDFEAQVRRKDGSISFILLNADWVEFGGQRLILSTGRDITERKQAEEELKKNEERYRFLADNGVDLIWMTDLQLKYTYLSPSVTRIYGFAPEEMLGQSAAKLLTPDSAQIALKKFTEELTMDDSRPKDRTQTVQLQHMHKDGSTVWAEVKMSFVRGPDGRPTGVLGFSRDITERKESEEGTKQYVKDLEVFYKASVGREEKILELKEEIKRLKQELDMKK
jgi:PAS domain S-box-containing protein